MTIKLFLSRNPFSVSLTVLFREVRQRYFDKTLEGFNERHHDPPVIVGDYLIRRIDFR